MDKIVKFDTLRSATEKKRGKSMYEELVSRLKSAPARKYVVREAENLADEVLEICGHVGKSAPTPIVKIANDFKFKTYKVHNIPDEISGNIFIGGTTSEIYGSDKVIIVGEGETLPHQRFIVAHELAHYLMDYIGNPEYSDSRILFTRTYPKINHSSSEEIRADRFAAELLMPKMVFLTEYVKAMKLSDYDKDYAVPYLAKTFGTKESSIQRRIQEVLE